MPRKTPANISRVVLIRRNAPLLPCDSPDIMDLWSVHVEVWPRSGGPIMFLTNLKPSDAVACPRDALQAALNATQSDLATIAVLNGSGINFSKSKANKEADAAFLAKLLGYNLSHVPYEETELVLDPIIEADFGF